MAEGLGVIKALRARVAELEEENRVLRAEVAQLRARLGMNSGNSSKPPSSDPPSPARPAKKAPTGRKPGGQPGHRGHHRELLPEEEVDHVEDVWPEQCEECHTDLSNEGCKVEVGEPFRHQVTELPPVVAVVTEWRLHSQCCPVCNHATQATLPPGVPTTSSGPRLQAVVASLTGVYRLSKRGAQDFMVNVFGARMSLGSVSAIEARVSEVLAAPVEQAHEYVQNQPVINADETGWREARKRAWLWVAVTGLVTVFMIHGRRNGSAAGKLLGRFAGILGTDRWSAYARHLLEKRQLCWAHYADARIMPSCGWRPRSRAVFGGNGSA